MEQHQIPQDVTGYKFNLFGILNLKQFLELIIPVGLAWLIIQLLPIPWIAWPVGVILGLYGILAAFVPIQSRPLNYWVTTFLSIMYAPTKFYWHKIARIPTFLKKDPHAINPATLSPSPLPNQFYQPISYQDYSASLSEPLTDPLDNPRAAFVNSLLDNFAQIPVAEVNAVAQNVRPNLSDEMTLRQREIQPAETFASQQPS